MHPLNSHGVVLGGSDKSSLPPALPPKTKIMFSPSRCEIFGVFFSSRSLKKREKYINFAQLVFLSLVFIFFEGSVSTFQFFNDKIHNHVFFDIIVNFIIQKLKSKRISLKKYTN